MKFKKADIVFIIVIAILTIISIDLLLVEAHREAFTNIWGTQSFSEDELYARLFIVFIVCVIGNLLPVPTPYSWAVCLGFAYFTISPFFPMLFAIVAACGCLIGEIVGYIVGRGASEIISDERAQNLTKYQDYLIKHPRLAPFLIFLFGLTPLNDDMLTVPLGLIKYDVKKTIIWIWLGKLGMMTIMAYNLFNICYAIGENWVVSIVTLYIIVIMIYVMVRVDIGKIFKRHVEKGTAIK